MSAHLWKQIGLVILVVVYSGGLVFSGYSYALKGRGDAIIDSLEKDKKLVDKARAETKVIEKQVIKYVDRIKTVHDDTGCADSVAVPALNDSLLQVYCATKGCETD